MKEFSSLNGYGVKDVIARKQIIKESENRNDANHNLQNEINSLKVFVTPQMYGAVCDGITDDTQAIQQAINSGKPVIIPEGTYMIKAHDPNVLTGDSVHSNHNYIGGLAIPSNTFLMGEGNVILKAIPNESTNYNIARVLNSDNVTIKNITFEGDYDTHEGTSGEWGHGLMILHSSNVIVENCKFINLWGDGVYIGILSNNTIAKQNENIFVNNIEIDRASRNGISLCSGKNILIDNAKITRVSRTAPKSAIDIEPELAGTTNAVLQNIKISNVYSSKNLYGIHLYYTSANTENVSVDINNITSIDDVEGVFISSQSTIDSKLKGFIKFENINIYESSWSSVLCQDWVSTAPHVKFKDINIVDSNHKNKNTLDNATGWRDGSGFVIITEDSTKEIGNISVENLSVKDTRDTKYINKAFNCSCAKGKNIELINPISLDSLNGNRCTNVCVVDPKRLIYCNLPYYMYEISGGATNFVMYSSGTTVRRKVNINPTHIGDGTKIVLINDSANGIIVDLDYNDGVDGRQKIYGFDNSARYIRTTVEGSTLVIEKINGKLFVVSQTGSWENTASE